MTSPSLWINERVKELSKLRLVPGAVKDPAVRKAVDEFGRLLRDARGALDAVGAAERKFKAAEEADIEALKAAKRAGKPDPGRRGVEEAERELAAARRNAEAAVRAAEDAREDVAAVVGERRDRLVAHEAEREAAAWPKFAEAVRAVEEAYLDLRAARAARAWAAGFPEATKPPPSLRLPGVTAANGDEYTVEAALAALGALRGLAAPADGRGAAA